MRFYLVVDRDPILQTKFSDHDHLQTIDLFHKHIEKRTNV